MEFNAKITIRFVSEKDFRFPVAFYSCIFI